ncbi:hypothetical protein FGO68_gene14617 [Halteria grandinella]|uniref:Uncharacterized protein n=1 Tax=Halteria grandinella TaxID=5974 RepID=A0A8J8NIV3_HALGN|nr:hypothetical protein FGO68_gene14617 [Halteria grandinella]
MTAFSDRLAFIHFNRITSAPRTCQSIAARFNARSAQESLIPVLRTTPTHVPLTANHGNSETTCGILPSNDSRP